MTNPPLDDRSPAPGSLLKSAAVALAAAALATLFFVLPAEYGVDPTGVGERLGLLELAAPGGDSAGPAPARVVAGEYPGIPAEFDFYEPDVLGEPFSRTQPTPFRTDTLEIRLEEFEQVELKAVMRQGDAIVYAWSVEEGIVYADFHADPGEDAPGYPDRYYIRYLESESAAESGSLVAPFDGNHGWYWLNIEEQPIVIRLRVAGYYERIDELFRSFQ